MLFSQGQSSGELRHGQGVLRGRNVLHGHSYGSVERGTLKTLSSAARKASGDTGRWWGVALFKEGQDLAVGLVLIDPLPLPSCLDVSLFLVWMLLAQSVSLVNMSAYLDSGGVTEFTLATSVSLGSY